MITGIKDRCKKLVVFESCSGTEDFVGQPSQFKFYSEFNRLCIYYVLMRVCFGINICVTPFMIIILKPSETRLTRLADLKYLS